MKRIFTSTLEARFDEGRITPEQFHAEAARNLGCNLSITAFKKIWNRIFTINPGISALLRRLKKDYRLLCLSNTNIWHFGYCIETFPVLNQFDAFILSFTRGREKAAAQDFSSKLPGPCGALLLHR